MTGLILVTMYLLPGRWWRMLNVRKFIRLRAELAEIVVRSGRG